MRIVQIGEAGLLTLVEVASKDDQRGTRQRGRMPTSGRRRDTLDLRESPEPLSLDYKKKK